MLLLDAWQEALIAGWREPPFHMTIREYVPTLYGVEPADAVMLRHVRLDKMWLMDLPNRSSTSENVYQACWKSAKLEPIPSLTSLDMFDGWITMSRGFRNILCY